MKPQELKLECEAFDEFRVNLDAAIRMAIKSMIAKDLGSGNVTAKIDITLKKEASEDGEVYFIPKFKPDINIKIGAKGNLKCKEKDGMVMKAGEKSLYIADNQVSIDDLIPPKEEES